MASPIGSARSRSASAPTSSSAPNDVPEAFPLTDPVSQLVYSARSSTVHTVVIDGKVVLEGRHPTRIESRAVFDEVQASVKRVFDRMGYRYERH